MLIDSGNITIHLREHRVSTQRLVTQSGIRKRNRENGNGNEKGNGNGNGNRNGICEGFQTIDLKKNSNDNTINKQIK